MFLKHGKNIKVMTMKRTAGEAFLSALFVVIIFKSHKRGW
uniref:Uncharacterized protein n=1 Tax=Anguilla anguilla TaxID=7936 RepID=A0A0E9PBX7_ANGAN